MTTPVLIALVLLLLAVVAYLVLRRAAPPREPGALARSPSTTAYPAPAALPTADASHFTVSPPNTGPSDNTPPTQISERPLPPELAGFRFTAADELPAAQRDALVAAMRQIPRPPRSLHKLISPAFLAGASSAEMSELVMSEPMVAAKVLSTVNSSQYGLQRPVASIGQAITFLGMNTVRGICVRYMLDESFNTKDAATQRDFDQLWAASAVASELCVRAAKQLQLPDAGALVTQVVLSFVGHMAVATLPQRQNTPGLTDLSLDLVQRYSAQQQALGLCAPEIGRLLMTVWELPASIVSDVGNIDRVLNTPALGLDAAAATRCALPYLSARLAERLAAGKLTDMALWDLATDEAPSSHNLGGYLSTRQQAALQVVFGSDETRAAITPLLA